MGGKAIFLDKDGTLINDIPYNVDPGLISLSENCVEGLKLLHNAGYTFVIVSNQSGVAHGYFQEPDLLPVKNKLTELLAAHQIQLKGFFYCPHHPDGKVERYAISCDCRKPKPGMLKNGAMELDINLSASWMIGDILNDVEAGNKAGCKTILIDNGNETEWESGAFRIPDFTCKTINEAALLILKNDEK